MMQLIDTIRINTVFEATDKSSPNCELIINEKPINQRVTGCILQTAFQCDVGYLVFLTHDCPFEKTLSIHLISNFGCLEDSIQLFWPYCTGDFKFLQIQQPNKILFRFFDKAKYKGDTIWTVTVLSKPSFHIPFFSEPLGVFRSFTFKKRISITAAPNIRQLKQQ